VSSYVTLFFILLKIQNLNKNCVTNLQPYVKKK
jgi:hypothetical protein